MQLLKLRQGMRSVPMPPAEQPVEQTIEQVFALEPDRVWLWFGVVPRSTLFIGALSSGREFISLNSLNHPQLHAGATNGCVEHTGCKI